MLWAPRETPCPNITRAGVGGGRAGRIAARGVSALEPRRGVARPGAHWVRCTRMRGAPSAIVTAALIVVVVIALGLPLLAWWVGGRRFWARLRPRAVPDPWGDAMRRSRLSPAETAQVESAVKLGSPAGQRAVTPGCRGMGAAAYRPGQGADPDSVPVGAGGPVGCLARRAGRGADVADDEPGLLSLGHRHVVGAVAGRAGAGSPSGSAAQRRACVGRRAAALKGPGVGTPRRDAPNWPLRAAS